jgi:hypothetical protein
MSHVRLLLLLLIVTAAVAGCKRTIPGASCYKDADCALGAPCVSGVCVVQDGKGCTQDSDCGTGPGVGCVEAVCHTAPVLTVAAPLDVDYDCSTEVCTGGVVNLASLADGKSVTFSGTVLNPVAPVTLQIGENATVSAAPNAAGEWSYAWEVGTTTGEVRVVVAAQNPLGDPVTIVRKLWVDVVAPTCKFGVAANARQVSRTTTLISCSKPLAPSTLRRAFTMAPAAGEIALNQDNAFYLALPGNTTYSLALADGAVDRAGNPVAALAAILFRTESILPIGESTFPGSYDFPHMAIDLDGLPFVFAWDMQEKGQVLFTWDGKGDGGVSNLGAWVKGTPDIRGASTLGPVCDFRLSVVPVYERLALKHAGHVLLAHVRTEGIVDAAYVESNDNLVTFRGALGGQEAAVFLSLSPRGLPAFAGLPGTESDSVFMAYPDDYLTFDGAQHYVRSDAGPVIAQHQVGFIAPEACRSGQTCSPEPGVWHLDAGFVPRASINILGSQHAVTGLGGTPAYVVWAERKVPSERLKVGCLNRTPPWKVSEAPNLGTPAAATIVGIELSKGVANVALAVDSAVNLGQPNESHYSQFGLLSGESCDDSIAVHWEGLGGAILGHHPAAAFSNEGVLWRVVVDDTGLRILTPIKP